jgi:hypothetical protein
MRRLTPSFVAVSVAIAVAVSAPASSAVLLPAQPAHLTGVIVSGDAFSLTVQTPGRAVGVLNALTSAADRLQAANYPYVWGGGHAEAGVASVGERGGPGSNGRRRGYDCSGAVAAVLTGAGLWPTGAWVPNDAGVISYMLRVGLIARGAGTGAHQVTLYDDPGVHIFMSINGRFFGTSDGGGGGDARGGPGWLDVGPDVTSSAFRRYHVLPGALDAKTDAGYTVGFELGVGLGLLDYPTGTEVSVAYKTTASGMLVAEAVTPIGETTTTGTVQSIGQDGSSLTITTSTGADTTFGVVAGSVLAQELAGGQVAPGDAVSVGYLGTPPSMLTLISLTVTSTPLPTTTATTPTSTATTPTTTAPPPTTTAPPASTTTTTTATLNQTAPSPQTDSGNNGGSGW